VSLIPLGLSVIRVNHICVAAIIIHFRSKQELAKKIPNKNGETPEMFAIEKR